MGERKRENVVRIAIMRYEDPPRGGGEGGREG